jgi:hypothetical protein
VTVLALREQLHQAIKVGWLALRRNRPLQQGTGEPRQGCLPRGP